MKKFLKFVCLTLALMCFCSVFISASALTGTVKLNDPNTWMNLRKTASTSGTIIAYVKHGTSVTILDGGSKTSGFYHITATSYTKRWTEGKANRTGYGHSDYIK